MAETIHFLDPHASEEAKQQAERVLKEHHAI